MLCYSGKCSISAPITGPDFRVSDHGSIVLIAPITDSARAWLVETVQSDAQWFGGALAVETRYAGDIIAAIVNETTFEVEYAS